jgi:hypothetical protein
MLRPGYSAAAIAFNIGKLTAEDLPSKQAQAIAYDHARTEFKRIHPRGKMPAYLAGGRRRNPTSVVPLDMVGDLAGLGARLLANPSDNTASELAQARDLFQKFTGLPANEVTRVDKPRIGKVALAVGYVDFIGYTTQRHNGEKPEVQPYIHRFKAAARPLLAVSHDGRVLLIIGGDFEFTELGITDNV